MFEIVSDVTEIQVIATGRGIKRLKHLRKRYGGRRWRKLKGNATVRLGNGSLRRVNSLVRGSRRGQAGIDDQAFLGLIT